MDDVRPRPFAFRLLVAAACIYGPFLVAPFAALLTGCEPCRETWFGTLATLPGRYPAAMVADAFGASPIVTAVPFAAALVAFWILFTAWCARECHTAPWYSAALSGTFAVVAVLAYAV